MTQTNSRRTILAGIIGNIIEHYDTSLFGFLVPFIAPQFFPTFHPLTAIILGYAMLPLDLIAKPLGSLYFGHIGDTRGRTRALSFSITGTAIMTGLMGFIPTYHTVGPLAPFLLASVRFTQKFLSAGESVGGAVFILEHYEHPKKGFLGSLYGCSTIIGILMASFLISLFDSYQLIQDHWRHLFLVGFATSIIGFYIRRKTRDASEFIQDKREKMPLWNLLKTYYKPFLAILATAGFTYATYEAAFIFLNTFSTLVSNVTHSQMLSLNTPLLIIDMLLLPLFGLFADRFSGSKQMMIAALIGSFAAIPTLLLCVNATYATLVGIRAFWMVLGVFFCAPFHAWTQQLVPPRHRYTLISLGYTIGSQLIGAPLASLGLYLYKTTGMALLPGIYLALTGLFAYTMIRFNTANETQRTLALRPAL